jgi:hypothetical protein
VRNASCTDLGQQLHLALQVGLGVIGAGQQEPLGADGDQVVPAVVELGDLADGRGAPDLVQGQDAVRPGLAALADRDHPERPRLWPR